MSSSGAEARVDELCQLGVNVTVTAGDIADPETAGPIMATFGDGRPLRGVTHTTGVLEPGVLSSMTPERCVTTLMPKAFGSWALHQATRHMDLDFMSP